MFYHKNKGLLHCKRRRIPVLLKIYGASTASYGKKVSSTYQNRHGRRWFQAESSSHCELAAKECTGGTFFSVPVVLFCLTPCIYASISKRHFRSGTDAAGSTQQQVCPANLQRKNVYGCTFLREDALQVR